MTNKLENSDDSPKRRGLFWPLFLVALLVGHVGILSVAAYIASSDPSVAAEPDFYEKALAWEQNQKLVREPAEDGYEVTPLLEPHSSATGQGQLSLALTREGQPLPQSTVSATIFHAARSGDRQHLTLTERKPGLFVAPANLHRDGRWEVRFELTTPERVYRFVRTIKVNGTTQ
jgi:FixH